MVKIRASFHAVGDSFSPATFAKISSVNLVRANEAGDIGTKGKHLGKPTPYGAGSVEVSDKAEEDWSRFDDLLTMVESCVEALREAGAEDLSLNVSLFHDGQCNFGFSKEEFARIAALKVDMTVSCYSEEVE